MYLTRVFLDDANATVRADLRSPVGLHRTVMRAFPNDLGESPRKRLGILYRVDSDREGRIALLIQSLQVPDLAQWPSGYALSPEQDLDLALGSLGDNPSTRSLEGDFARFEVGRKFAFRLLANTTRKINTKTLEDGVRRHGQRVPVWGEVGRTAWLRRRAELAGFVVDESSLRVVEVSPVGTRDGVTLAGALFSGALRISNAPVFRAAVSEGIGPGKAYGFGLLSVAQIRE